jgi:hypothetical protein
MQASLNQPSALSNLVIDRAIVDTNRRLIARDPDEKIRTNARFAG